MGMTIHQISGNNAFIIEIASQGRVNNHLFMYMSILSLDVGKQSTVLGIAEPITSICEVSMTLQFLQASVKKI